MATVFTLATAYLFTIAVSSCVAFVPTSCVHCGWVRSVVEILRLSVGR